MRSSDGPAIAVDTIAASGIKVLLVSTSYPANLDDWRGVFIRFQAESLARRSDVRLRLWSPPGEIPANAINAATPVETRWLARLMAAGGIAHLIRNSGVRGMAASLSLVRMLAAAYRRNADVDIYHINWLQCALPLPANGKPVLISVLGNDMKLLHLPLMKSLLRRAMRHRKVTICPNADWMRKPLVAAFGDIAGVRPVSFGIDPCWYHIERELLPDRRIWLAVTRLTTDKLGPLFEWSESLFHDSDRELHLFGPMQEKIDVPEWVHYHGSATPEQLSNEWFPRAHGLISLSRHAEGCPQVMLEAMAASLPIIASRIPAHVDLVADGVTGYLCNSQEDYANALRQLNDVAENHQRGENARAHVARKIGTWDDCAARYARIYHELLAQDVHG